MNPRIPEPIYQITKNTPQDLIGIEVEKQVFVFFSHKGTGFVKYSKRPTSFPLQKLGVQSTINRTQETYLWLQYLVEQKHTPASNIRPYNNWIAGYETFCQINPSWSK